tara:strand:+ start:631 stop:1152 length:522 start_codon:yes stop_codon:yes gene_type:complete
MDIDVSVTDEFSDLVSEVWLRKVANTSLHAAFPDSLPGHVSILITGDSYIQHLNATYRGLNEITDVLAFSSQHNGHWEGEIQENPMLEDNSDSFVFPPDIIQPLGEIVISYPQIERQALENNNSISKELSFITGHGILHLAGYDHEEPDEAEIMRSKEVEILSQINFEDDHDI